MKTLDLAQYFLKLACSGNYVLDYSHYPHYTKVKVTLRPQISEDVASPKFLKEFV